jgi:hypothetical protein
MSYYLHQGGVYFKLDGTTKISVTESARVTSHPTYDRKTVSDNYIVDNAKASFTGVITDIKTVSSLNKMGTSEYLSKLKASIGRRTAFDFKYDLAAEEEDNWFITELTHDQDQIIGVAGEGADNKIIQAFTISMSLERITQATAITSDVIVPKAYSDSLAKKDSSSKTTKQFNDKQTDLDKKKQADERADYHWKKAQENWNAGSETEGGE